MKTDDLDTALNIEKSKDMVREINFEEAFELTGHGKFNHLVLLTSGLIMLNVSMESVGMSYVITAAECELRLTSQDKGMVNAAAFIGIISTSFLWGYLGDRLGRRAVMLPAMVLSAVLSVASSFSTNVMMLIGLRFLTGCLVSASSATVYAYLGEMHITSKRASAIAWGSVFISFSFMMLPGLAWVIIPGSWSLTIGTLVIMPWRVFIWAWCVPGLLAAAALLVLPESPRYLLAAKGPERALPVLAKMYAWNHGRSDQSFPQHLRIRSRRGEGCLEEEDRLLSSGPSNKPDNNPPVDQRFRNDRQSTQVDKINFESTEALKSGGFVGALNNITLMFRPPLLRCVFISHISMFAVFMLSSGLYVWVPDILNNILRSTSERSITICEIIHENHQHSKNMTLESPNYCQSRVSVGVFPISMAMGAVFALTYLAIGFFINRIGRKTLYCAIMFICGAATVAAAFVPQGGAATALLILALCAGCAASILAAIAVDVFPTCLRAMAMCVMYMVGRAGAAAGSYVLGATLNTHCQLALTAFGVFTAGSTLLMVFWPQPEKVRSEMEQRGLTY